MYLIDVLFSVLLYNPFIQKKLMFVLIIITIKALIFAMENTAVKVTKSFV